MAPTGLPVRSVAVCQTEGQSPVLFSVNGYDGTGEKYQVYFPFYFFRAMEKKGSIPGDNPS